MSSVLDEIIRSYGALPEADKAKLAGDTLAATAHLKFIPNPGPQTLAVFSPADVLLYGGQGGGGKSFTIIGLALEHHRRSLIMRRRYADLGALTEEAVKLNGTREGFAAAPRPKLVTADNRLIEFGACQHLGDEQSWQGQPHDLLGVDEATQFLEQQIRYLMGWVRTTTSGQRTRVVLATNPPLSADGDWIIGMFRPWLDVTHHNPAKPGELRWFVTDPSGKDLEVDGPNPVTLDGKTLKPMSRTFIPASVNDNPFLAGTDYQAKLDALPEPLRSAVRDGNFMAARADDEFQIIPVDWVRQAIRRWTPQPLGGVPMCAMGVDVAAGGRDNTIIACRYDGWYAPLVAVPGERTPLGTDVAGLVLAHRRDNAIVVLDMGGGFGNGPYDHLKANQIETVGFIPGGGAASRTADRKMSFKNQRAEAWWKFREALDPAQEHGSPVMLPDDPALLADLTAPCLKPESLQSGVIQVESKEDIKKRLGRSTDRADAVVMAYYAGAKAITHATLWRDQPAGKRAAYGHTPKVTHGYSNRKGRA